jgi:hypothetical protein
VSHESAQEAVLAALKRSGMAVTLCSDSAGEALPIIQDISLLNKAIMFRSS